MKCCVWPSCPGAAADPQEPNQTHLQSGPEASAGSLDCCLTCEVPPGTAWCVDVKKEREDIAVCNWVIFILTDTTSFFFNTTRVSCTADSGGCGCEADMVHGKPHQLLERGGLHTPKCSSETVKNCEKLLLVYLSSLWRQNDYLTAHLVKTEWSPDFTQICSVLLRSELNVI